MGDSKLESELRTIEYGGAGGLSQQQRAFPINRNVTKRPTAAIGDQKLRGRGTKSPICVKMGNSPTNDYNSRECQFS